MGSDGFYVHLHTNPQPSTLHIFMAGCPRWISEPVIHSVIQKLCICTECIASVIITKGKWLEIFILKNPNKQTSKQKKQPTQNQLCCSLTDFRRPYIVAFIKSMYSRYFKTGVENASEEWHFSGMSYALPPQTLTGNPWGKYENNVEEGAQLALPLNADKFPALTSCSTV